MSFPSPLDGKTVVVTRPLTQAQNMLQLLESKQAITVHFPVMQISAADDIQNAQEKFRQIEEYDTLIFISANAVHYAISSASELGINFKQCNLAAVGPATMSALEANNYLVTIVPKSGFSSEDLLSDIALKEVKDKKILIIRGQGGRELLFDTLDSRGAIVEYAEVYQRQLPKQRNPIRLDELNAQDSAILLSSAESAQNLWSLCTEEERLWLTTVKTIVGSQRIAEAITRVGYKNNSIIADNPSDQAMLAAVMNCFKTI